MTLNFQKSDGGRSRFRFDEHNDCSVRALAIVTGVPYPTVHAEFERRGRKFRGSSHPLTTRAVARLFGMEVRTHKPTTVRRFVERHQSGRYVLCLSGHVVALISGVLHDLHPSLCSPRRRVVRHFLLR